MAGGPLVGGLLMGAGFGWRSIFLINVPLAAVALALTIRFEQVQLDVDVPGHVEVTPATGLLGIGCDGSLVTQGGKVLAEPSDERAALILTLIPVAEAARRLGVENRQWIGYWTACAASQLALLRSDA